MDREAVEGWLAGRQATLYLVAWQAYREAYTLDGLSGRFAMERAVQAVLKALGNKPYHVAEFTEDRYVIQHPLACRPDLIACPYSQAECSEPPAELGRYRVTVEEGTLIPVGDREGST